MSQKTNQVIGKIENALFSKVSFLNSTVVEYGIGRGRVRGVKKE